MPRSTSSCFGFTLIELIATIVVLGILAAVAVTRFVDFSEEARQSALIRDIKTFENAIFLYRAKRELGADDDRESASNTGAWSNQQWVEYSREQLQDYIAVWPDTTPYGGVYAFRFYDGTEGNWITNWRHVDTNEQLVAWTDNPGGLNFQPFELLMLRFTDTGSGESDQAAEEKVLEFLQTTPFASRIYRYGSQNNIAVLMR